MPYDYASTLLSSGSNDQASSEPYDYSGALLGSKKQPSLTSNIKMESDPGGAASAGTIAGASFSDDPRKQIEYFASKRFPKLKPAEAIDRYGIISGQIFYRGDDNKLHQEIPDGYSAGSILKNAATVSSKAIPFAAGLAGGVASAPMLMGGPAGIAGSMAITGAAASAGEGLRQWIGSKLTGDPVDTGEIAKEGAINAVGQGVGGLLAKYGARNVAQDIGHMNSTEAQALRAKAEKEGIQLTPAEETGLASLKNKQKFVGNMPQSMNEMEKFYGKREGDVNTAIGKFLRSLSPVDSIEEAGTMGVNAAGKAVKTAVDDRIAIARPFYEKVMSSSNNTINTIDARPIIQDKYFAGLIKSVKANPLYGMEALPDASLPVLDATKKIIDDSIEVAKRAGESNKVRLLMEKKDQLVKAADKAFPDYAAARSAWAGESPLVDELKGGLVGKISQLDILKSKNAANLLLGKASGPIAIRKAMTELTAASPEAAQALKRAYLQDVFEQSSKETVQGSANVAGNFRKTVFGNPQQVQRLQSALTTQEYRSLSDLADVLQAASSVKRIGSDTAWNEATKQAEEAAARPMFAKLMRNINPAQALRSFDDWLTTRGMGNNAEVYAKAITQPGASEKLKALQKLSPNSIVYRVIIGDMLAQSTASAAGSVVNRKETDSPRRLQDIIEGATTRLNQQ